MQNLSIFGSEGGFFLNTLLKVLWEDISSYISFALTIIILKMMFWQFLSLSNLSGAQAFHIHEVVEIVVIR